MTMKALNPFNAPGSPQAERQRKRRERFKIAVWTIVGANVLLFAGMLIQGCQREPATTGTPEGNPVETAASDTNGAAMAQQTPGTNAPVTPGFEAPATNAAAVAAVTSAAPNPVQAGPKQYVVVKGDSFYKIAKAQGVLVKALAEANPGVDSAKLKIGQVLQVPAGAEPATASPGAAPARASATANQSTGRYVVKSGDTLGRIARAHGTTVQAIKAANGLTNDRIVVGRSLKLPETRASRTSGTEV
jgi:LysM repeat protein